MIDRRDITGLTVAVLAHVGLIAAIYYWPWHEKEVPPPPPEPIQVTLADDVALVSAAPDPSDVPPAPVAQGPEAPIEPEVGAPEPDKKANPKPTKTDPNAAEPAPPKPPTKGPPAKTPPRAGGGGLPDYSKELGPAPERTDGTGTKSQATMTGEAQQNILTAIKRQVQPCADRQVSPAPEAAQIIAVVQLKLNPNGSLASVRIVDHKGVNDSNQRYVARVDDAVEAIFAGCTPIRGLPAELYDVPRGWKSLKFNYTLTN